MSRDDFEFWLCDMSDRLDWLMQQIPPEIERRLDYSAHSLNSLEEWMLQRYSTASDITKESEKPILDALSVYVGECIRLEYGGVWNINLSNTRDVFFGLPVVQKANNWVECPVSLVASTVDRRVKGYLSGCVAALNA
jgi:hypothetical protein